MALVGAAGAAGWLGPGAWMALSSVAFWLLASLLVGLLANRLPDRWLLAGRSAFVQAPSGRVPKGRAKAVLGIRIWKRWIPDAGAALPGGIAKARLVRREPAALQRFWIETRRAELVHWALWGAALVTALWLPPAGVLVNGLFATAFNLPCLLLQRFNRWRVLRVLALLQAQLSGRPCDQGCQ